MGSHTLAFNPEAYAELQQHVALKRGHHLVVRADEQEHELVVGAVRETHGILEVEVTAFDGAGEVEVIGARVPAAHSHTVNESG